MLKRALSLKKFAIITMSTAILSSGIVGLSTNAVHASELTKSTTMSTTAAVNYNYGQLLMAPVINSNDVENIQGMTSVYTFATVGSGITLDVNDQPNGYKFDSIGSNALVDVYDTYVDSNGVKWALVKYMVPGTENAQRGWVHFINLSYI